MPDPRDLRDHGYGDVATPDGVPVAVVTNQDMPCPNCECQLLQVTLKVKNPKLKGGKGTGMYLGCPACPYASPMLTTAG